MVRAEAGRLKPRVLQEPGYTVARLTPSVVAMVPADSPLACIRCARAAFFSSSAWAARRTDVLLGLTR